MKHFGCLAKRLRVTLRRFKCLGEAAQVAIKRAKSSGERRGPPTPAAPFALILESLDLYLEAPNGPSIGLGTVEQLNLTLVRKW